MVLYNPDKDIFKRLKKLACNSDKVLVILNQKDLFCEFDLNIENAELIILGENRGLAKALNVGIKKALSDISCTFIALFDQDSMLVNDKSILKITKYFLKYPNHKIGLIGHTSIDIKLTHNSKSIGNEIEEVDDIITSGSIIPCNVLLDVGLMDENLFIDYIDYEWCLRAKSMGYKIFKSSKSFINHNLGDDFINIAGIYKPIHNNPIRKYYIIRNCLILLSRDYIPILWKLKHLLKLSYRIPGYILFSDEKFNSILVIKKSFTDYFNNRKEFKNYKY